MGHHIDENGYFQSDKHPELPHNKIALDFRDIHARPCLKMYASLTLDLELKEDILTGLENTKNQTRIPD